MFGSTNSSQHGSLLVQLKIEVVKQSNGLVCGRGAGDIPTTPKGRWSCAKGQRGKERGEEQDCAPALSKPHQLGLFQ